jgi:hypothetical protein
MIHLDDFLAEVTNARLQAQIEERKAFHMPPDLNFRPRSWPRSGANGNFHRSWRAPSSPSTQLPSVFRLRIARRSRTG